MVDGSFSQWLMGFMAIGLGWRFVHGLFMGAAVEIGEVVRGGRSELWRDCAWWFRWGSCSSGDLWVVVSCG